MVTTIADPAGHELAVGGSDDGGPWMKASPGRWLASPGDVSPRPNGTGL